MTHAITFIFHGSSKESANLFAKELIDSLHILDQLVNIAFLESGSPSIAMAIEEHLVKGAAQIDLYPLFLVPGNHVGRDIPAIVQEVQSKNPHCQIVLKDFLGASPFFRELLNKITAPISPC